MPEPSIWDQLVAKAKAVRESWAPTYKDLATPERQNAMQGFANLVGPGPVHPASIPMQLAQPQITAAIKALQAKPVTAVADQLEPEVYYRDAPTARTIEISPPVQDDSWLNEQIARLKEESKTSRK